MDGGRRCSREVSQLTPSRPRSALSHDSRTTLVHSRRAGRPSTSSSSSPKGERDSVNHFRSGRLASTAAASGLFCSYVTSPAYGWGGATLRAAREILADGGFMLFMRTQGYPHKAAWMNAYLGILIFRLRALP